MLRVRPKAMTVAVIDAGLFPTMWGGGTGSEVMQGIAAPMVGGIHRMGPEITWWQISYDRDHCGMTERCTSPPCGVGYAVTRHT